MEAFQAQPVMPSRLVWVDVIVLYTSRRFDFMSPIYQVSLPALTFSSVSIRILLLSESLVLLRNTVATTTHQFLTKVTVGDGMVPMLGIVLHMHGSSGLARTFYNIILRSINYISSQVLVYNDSCLQIGNTGPIFNI